MSKRWPEDLQLFIESVEWTFAKTYAESWPHHYIVKERVDNDLFEKAVEHIRRNGRPGPFYHRTILYFEQDGLIYWTMVFPEGDPRWYPVEEETIINKCPVESTYEYRFNNGTLPD